MAKAPKKYFLGAFLLFKGCLFNSLTKIIKKNLSE